MSWLPPAGLVAPALALGLGLGLGLATGTPGIARAGGAAEAPVLRLSTPGQECTATLIAPRRAVTAAHCLYRAEGGLMRPAAVRVQAVGAAAGPPVRARALYPAAGFSRAMAAGKDDAPAADWGLVVLPRRPEGVPAPAGRAPDSRLDEGLRLIAAIEAEAAPEAEDAPGLRRWTGCRLNRRGQGLAEHDCPAPKGSSGAPFLVRTDDGWDMAALQVGRLRGADGGITSLAVRLPAGLADLALPGPAASAQAP